MKDLILFGIVIWQAISLISTDSKIKDFEDRLNILQDQNLTQERDLTELKLEQHGGPPPLPRN